MSQKYEKNALKAYVESPAKLAYFEKTFAKLAQNKWAFVWSWPGFFFGFWYLFYRRAFFYGAVWFALFMLLPIPIENRILLSSLLGGVLIPRLLYIHYLRLKKETEEKYKTNQERLALLESQGGRTRWAIGVPVFLTIAFLLMMAPFLKLFVNLAKVKTPVESSRVIATFIEEKKPEMPKSEIKNIQVQLADVFIKVEKKEISQDEAGKKFQEVMFRVFVNEKD